MNELACRIVYEKATGKIVHHTLISPGSASPDDNDIEAHAMNLATSDKARSAQELAIISADPKLLRSGYRHSVDVAQKELRAEPV